MEIGSTVKIAVKTTLQDGTVVSEATVDEPMEFQTGMNLVVDGLEKEILQMNEVGEKRSFTVSEYDAFGEYLDDFTQKIPMEQIPVDGLKPGRKIVMHSSDSGEPMLVTVIGVEDGMVEFDMNHPLAGEKLNYEVELLDIQDPPENFVSYAEKEEHMKQNAKMLGGDQGDDYR